MQITKSGPMNTILYVWDSPYPQGAHCLIQDGKWIQNNYRKKYCAFKNHEIAQSAKAL